MPKSIRKFSDKTQSSDSAVHILSFLNKNVDIDRILRGACKSVFDLDDISFTILEKLAENGNSNINQIAEKGISDRFAVSRRIYGKRSKINLLENDFVRIVETRDFKNTNKEEKIFSLTLKGILASLSGVKFENIKGVSNYYNELKERAENIPNLIEIAILYAKFHIALELLWTKMNKLHYTETGDFNELFFENQTNSHIQIGILGKSSSEDWESYNQVLIRYGVLKHTLHMLIKNNYRKVMPTLYSDKRVKHIIESLKRKGQDPVKSFFVRYLIKDWALYLDMSTIFNRKKEFVLIDYGSNMTSRSIGLVGRDIDATELYEQIRNQLGLKKSEVSVLTTTKYGKGS